MGNASVDRRGNPVTGSLDAVEKYDHAIDQLTCFQNEVLDTVTALGEQHGDFAMGNALGAYLALSSSDGRDVPAATEALGALDGNAGNDRERTHAAAIRAWVEGDWAGASRILDDLLASWPADLLALMLGHQLDFFQGDARNLRDRPSRSLFRLGSSHPDRGVVLGMQAFGLEESGHYDRAEEVGLEAVDANPKDVWAIHAVVHSLEMRGFVDEGIRFLRPRVDDWGDGNFLAVHNWWHLALYHLEAGLPEQALVIYDEHVQTSESAGLPLEMVDASALLWRLHLDGVDVGDRFSTLAEAWASAAADPWYAFNDAHAVMAYVGAGRMAEARSLIDRLDAYVNGPADGTNRSMTAEVGLPMARALVAFEEGRYDDAIDDIAPRRRQLHHFGGSHAQRDAFERTALEAAMRSGRHDLAVALLAERLSQRDTSVYAWTRQARVMRAVDRLADAERAEQAAAAHRARFAAATRD